MMIDDDGSELRLPRNLLVWLFELAIGAVLMLIPAALLVSFGMIVVKAITG